MQFFMQLLNVLCKLAQSYYTSKNFTSYGF